MSVLLEIGNGLTTTVDSEDMGKISLYKWRLAKNGYVVSVSYIKGSGRKNQKNRCIYLHRFLTNAPFGKVVDHINRNPLDNRKVNLRVGNQRMNMLNARMLKNNTSGVKGVSWNKGIKKWEAYIHYLNKKIKLGYFKDKRDAINIRKQAFIDSINLV